jgi:hypothetical protein
MTWNGGTPMTSTSTIYALITSSNYNFFFWRTLVVVLECLIEYKFPSQPQHYLDPGTLESVTLGIRKKSIDAWNNSPTSMHSHFS